MHARLSAFIAIILVSLAFGQAQASVFMRIAGATDPFAALFRPESNTKTQVFDVDSYRLPARSSFLDLFRPKPQGKLILASLDVEEDELLFNPVVSGFEDYGYNPFETIQSIKRVEKIRPGDTLSASLKRAGVQAGDREGVRKALSKVFNLTKLQADWDLHITFRPTKGRDTSRYIERLEIQTSPELKYLVRRTDNGFRGEEDRLELIKNHIRATIEVQDSLFVDAKRAGVPDRIVANTDRIFRHQLNFSKDISPGDTIEILYEEFRDDKGVLIKTDKLLYGKVNRGGKKYELYRFKQSSGAVAYFTPTGRNPGSRETLSRKPITSSCRLSSRFGRRRHPITKKYSPHRGVDYACKSGTPIVAAGSGKITYRGSRGAYGNLVEIDHGQGYKTRYAHMRAFKRGQKVGSRVNKGVTIGFVGTTGRSTGPHLHYEIWKNGTRVNPLKTKLPAGNQLQGRDKANFGATRNLVSRMLKNAKSPRSQLASN